MRLRHFREKRTQTLKTSQRKLWNYRPKWELRGMNWEFNPYDDDDHPSVPHGDSLNHRYSIDLRNGDVYEKREQCGRLLKKEFERLKKDPQIHRVISEAQSYYREHYPQIKLDPIPWYDETKAQRCAVYHRRIGQKNYIISLVVIIRHTEMKSI